LSDLLVFLPVLGAVVVHAPVLKFDLFKSLKKPVDGGRGWFGTNKTWRGAVFMTLGPLLATLVLWDLMPDELRDEPALLVGLLIGLGTFLGELPNSFLKRRMGIAPGQRRTDPLGVALIVYDQADFVPGIALMLLPLWVMPIAVLLVGFVAVAAVHFLVNVIGYWIGARTAPI
jgi:hypothetical protein